MTHLTMLTREVFKPLDQPSRYKGAWGGRGSGKSWHFVARIIAGEWQRDGFLKEGRIVAVRGPKQFAQN
jgi:phage terminase large subunit